MSKKRILVAGAGVLLALGLGVGIAGAQTADDPSTDQPAAACSTSMDDHDTMHQRLREQMPEDMQAQCDANHARMGDGHGSMHSGGSGGMGMMGSQMMGSR